MQRYQFTKVDTILAKYHRDFRGLDINEGDAIEWIGEAVGFMKIASASEEAIAFMEVKNYQAALPNGLHYIIQVAKNHKWSKPEEVSCTPKAIVSQIIPQEQSQTTCSDCYGDYLEDSELHAYTPYFDLQYEYLQWAKNNFYKANWTPIRLANHTFFNTLVCQIPESDGLYHSTTEEYTIVEDQLRFNFKEGFVALAYLRQRVDCETGYPMIPDNEYAKAAITYYMVWKIKQREAYLHRESSANLADKAQQEWEKYIKRFKNNAKMPFGADQYQNLSEQSKYILPRHNRYYGFFGKLGTMENRVFNDPVKTNRYRYLSGNAGFIY